MSEYMSIYDAADRFHITPQTIYYHVNRGHFKVIDKENGYGQLVDADEIQEMIDAKSKKKGTKEKKHRIRMDGEVLTINDSDKLANKYHPRAKKGETA